MNFKDFLMVFQITALITILFHIADLIIILIKKSMSSFKGKQEARKEQVKEAKIIEMNGGQRPTANKFQFRILPPYQKKNNTINFMPLLFNSMIDPRINMRVTIFTLMNFNFTWIKHNGKK